MKRIIVLLQFAVALACAQQPFTFGFSAGTYYAQQGIKKEIVFPVNVQTAPGYNSSIYLTLSVSNILKETIVMTSSVLNHPNYNALKISLPHTFTTPKGNYIIKLKGENTGVSWVDSCILSVRADSCPSWFKYTYVNSPLLGTASEVPMFDAANNIWMCSSQYNTTAYSISKFDFNQWHVWTTTGLKVYNQDRNLLSVDTSQKISPAHAYMKMGGFGNTVYVMSTSNFYSIYNDHLTEIDLPAETAVSWITFGFDKNQTLYVANNRRIYKRSGSSWILVNLYTPPFNPDFNTVEFDNDDNLWVTTGQKVFRLSGQFWTTYGNNVIGLARNVGQNKIGEIWCSGTGLFKFNNVTNVFDKVLNETSTADLCFDTNNNPVISKDDYSIYAYKNNSLQLIAKYDPSLLFAPYGFPNRIAISSDNNLLLSTGYNGCIGYCNSTYLPVGIEQETNVTDQITLYPNPANDKVCINMAMNGAVVKIFSLEGNLLKEERISGGVNCFDVSGITPGLYLVAVEDLNSRVVRKLVIQ